MNFMHYGNKLNKTNFNGKEIQIEINLINETIHAHKNGKSVFNKIKLNIDYKI